MSFEAGTATDVADLLDKLEAFLAKGHALEPQYSGAGTGRITGLIGTASSVVEQITVTFTSATDFDVAGSVSGALASGSVETPYSETVVAFTITDESDWEAGDEIVFQMTSPWTLHREVTGSEYIWEAPGNDDAGGIFVGVLRFTNVTGDYDNLRLGGFTGFAAGNSFANQPGTVGGTQGPVLPLHRTASINFWFVASGRRVIIVAKNSTVYDCAYLGLIDSYANPNQYPLPLAVGGSMAWVVEPAATSQNWRWSYSGLEHRAFPFGSTTQTRVDPGRQLRLRRPDGVWEGFSSALFVSGSESMGIVWPSRSSALDLRANLDGGYPLLPMLLLQADATTGSGIGFVASNAQAWGELSGVFWTTGHAQAAENTITIGRTEYLVVPNVNLTSKDNWFAVKLS